MYFTVLYLKIIIIFFEVFCGEGGEAAWEVGDHRFKTLGSLRSICMSLKRS